MLTDEYNLVNEGNWESFCLEAIRQYQLMVAEESLSGYEFVDWRINFANLHTFTTIQAPNKAHLLLVKEFHSAYESSTDILYHRLGLDDLL